MTNKARRSPTSRGRKRVSTLSIMKLVEMLERLSAVASLFWRAGSAGEIRAAKQRFGKVRAEIKTHEAAFIEETCRLAIREARRIAKTSSNTDEWIAAAASYLRTYLNVDYTPVVPEWIKPASDVFTDPFERLGKEQEFHENAHRLAAALRAFALSETVPVIYSPPPVRIDLVNMYGLVESGYREPNDLPTLIALLRDFRIRVSWVTKRAKWPIWEKGTRRKRGFAVRRVRQMESLWIADAVRAEYSFDKATALFRSAGTLANDLAILPIDYPGSKSLKSPMDGLKMRCEAVLAELTQVARLATAQKTRLMQVHPVTLDGPGKQLLILGQAVPRLYGANYKLINALVDAGPAGLSKNQLDRIASNAPTYLRRLRKHNPNTWGEVIQMAGRKGSNYRIGLTRQTCSP